MNNENYTVELQNSAEDEENIRSTVKKSVDSIMWIMCENSGTINKDQLHDMFDSSRGSVIAIATALARYAYSAGHMLGYEEGRNDCKNDTDQRVTAHVN